MDTHIENIVREAGATLARRFRQGDRGSEKRRFDLVTDTDREVEAQLAEGLRSLFPHDGILGEETGETPGASGTRWLVDPLDGTADFVMGKPYFAVSVAKEDHGRITEAYVYNPIADEFYTASEEPKTSCLNGNPISVASTPDLREALVVFGFSARMDRIHRYYREWQWIFEGCRKAVGWTTPALTLCNVARGRIDVFIDIGASPVGHAAAALILKNAGGIAMNYDLDPYDHRREGVVGCTPTLLHEVRRRQEK